jgi:hypothetical protein
MAGCGNFKIFRMYPHVKKQAHTYNPCHVKNAEKGRKKGKFMASIFLMEEVEKGFQEIELMFTGPSSSSDACLPRLRSGCRLVLSEWMAQMAFDPAAVDDNQYHHSES